jgi:hypothetical protein
MSQRFSASNASKHMACHASANLPLAIPGWTPPIEDPTANNAANKGTRLHANFADLMQLSSTDVENFSAALEYVAKVRRRRRFTSLIEQEMKATWLVTPTTTTADLVLHTQDELHILDLKTGKTPVDPAENSQLLFYAATYGHLAPKAKGAYLHIVQPWAGIMDEWFAPTQRIAQFMADALAAEAAIAAGDTTFNPGDHCTFCDANPRSRGAKGYPLCPSLLSLYYPTAPIDVDQILGLED